MKITILALAFFSCTENARSRHFGGEMTVDLPCGQQLYDVTWKDNDFWYATKPMPPGYTPVTYTFQAESSWGLMEGTVYIKECS